MTVTKQILTNEEAAVPLYNGNQSPTDASKVTPNTPLGDLYLNWSEKELPERLRTRHVHRLHPYLGKFIPQLVEVFLRKYFKPRDKVLDPFSGSGTTMIQANELGIHSVGCDISKFNVMLGEVKTANYDVVKLRNEVHDIITKTKYYAEIESERTLFTIDRNLRITSNNEFLKTWFHSKALKELLIFKQLIEDYENKDFLRLVLSRSARSARLTTHFDLDFPKKPVTEPYYCYKHSRECRPTDDAFKFLNRYSLDAVKRVEKFATVRTNSSIKFIHGDSRKVEFPKVDGVVTSPPYVGMIDYHEQHRYAYELLGIEDRRDEEIGSSEKGKSKKAVEVYKSQIAEVFVNASKAIKKGGKLIVVAGDKSNLYPEIGELANLELEDTIQRHVNRRTGRRSGAFFETVFIYTK